MYAFGVDIENKKLEKVTCGINYIVVKWLEIKTGVYKNNYWVRKFYKYDKTVV